jgi:hypothetical protein
LGAFYSIVGVGLINLEPEVRRRSGLRANKS